MSCECFFRDGLLTGNLGCIINTGLNDRSVIDRLFIIIINLLKTVNLIELVE